MKLSFTPVAALLFFLLCFAGAANAQRILIKVTDENNSVLTNGGSLLNGFVGQTEAIAMGQESSTCTTGGPGCTPITGNFIFTLYTDATITDYQRALYLRKVWRKVEISYVKTISNGQFATYYKITLQDVSIVGITNTGDGDGSTGLQVKMDPVKIQWTYIPQNANGSLGNPRSFGFDRSTNTSF